MKISVAMATYNGEACLNEQLESLVRQEHQPYELVVGDDGSSDRTLDILRAFAARAPFPVRVTVNPERLGFGENFLQTARRCSGEWIAFCDQDDVWLPHKLAACATAIEKEPSLNMVLQYAELCNGQLDRSGRMFPTALRPGAYGPNDIPGFWVWLGFLQTFRRELIDLNWRSRPTNYFPGHRLQSHDKWTCMVANALGDIRVLEGVAALYRRHSGALTGPYKAKPWRERIRQARRVPAAHYRFLSQVAEESADCLCSLADEAERQDWAGKFTESSEKFRVLSKVFAKRSDLYDSGSGLRRLKCFLDLLREGGYWGDPFIALGWKSAAKDLARVVLGERMHGDRAL